MSTPAISAWSRNRSGTVLRAALIASSSLFLISTADARVDFTARQLPGDVHSGSLIGAPVLNTTGETVGNVNYLLLDGSGRVTTVVLGVGGFLGIGEKNVGIPFAALRTETADGKTVFRVDASRSEIDAAPPFVWGVKPLAVGIEDGIKNAANKANDAAKRLGERANDAGTGPGSADAVKKPGGTASDATKDREPMSDAVESDSVKQKSGQPEAPPSSIPGPATGSPQSEPPTKTQ